MRPSYLHVRANIIRTPALMRLRTRLGKSLVETLGLVVLQDPSVAEWIADHPELVRPPKLRRRRAGGRVRRRDIPRRIRMAVYERDGYRCVLCGSPDDLTLDHIVFHSEGGSDEASNLRTACHGCNSRRQPRRRRNVS